MSVIRLLVMFFQMYNRFQPISHLLTYSMIGGHCQMRTQHLTTSHIDSHGKKTYAISLPMWCRALNEFILLCSQLSTNPASELHQDCFHSNIKITATSRTRRIVLTFFVIISSATVIFIIHCGHGIRCSLLRIFKFRDVKDFFFMRL